ncbi:fimbrial assembly protein [Pantoea rodasii]|uniref:Fimbrial assembly protein n=1 Tax=Pantoea rodasii TaxID=1076549 RepID=A0A2M9WHX4_9GAMM|nr:CS1 type fimbrial major subunit [Pantoea rodasii]PJZ07141.1 fimbrial assembly protein [Pantoea rodasii]
MKKLFLITLASAGLLSAVAAQAVQQNITVTANVDSSVGITQSDGSPLPSSIAMQYMPARGLIPWQDQVKVWTNSNTDNINVSLATLPVLTDDTAKNTIPLTVSLNGTALATTASTLTYASIFPAGTTNGSSPLPLVISQTSGDTNLAAGTYTGVVSLILAQATSPKS